MAVHAPSPRALSPSAAELEEILSFLPPNAVRWAESDSSPSPSHSEARHRASASKQASAPEGHFRLACPHRAELPAELPFDSGPRGHPALPLYALARSTAVARKTSLDHAASSGEGLRVDWADPCPNKSFPAIRHPAPRGRPLRKYFSSVTLTESARSQDGGCVPAADVADAPALAAGPPAFPGRGLRRYVNPVRDAEKREAPETQSPKSLKSSEGFPEVFAGFSRSTDQEGLDKASWPAWRSSSKAALADMRHPPRSRLRRRPESAPCISSLLNPTSLRSSAGDVSAVQAEAGTVGGAGDVEAVPRAGRLCAEDAMARPLPAATTSDCLPQLAAWTMFAKQFRGHSGGPLELIARLPCKRYALPKAKGMQDMPYVLKEPYPAAPSDSLCSNIYNINALIASRRRALSKSGIVDAMC
ncbi:unnamed protein product [Symbiodinium natans]|uniref:Uncharacterized protein n=1 Tax=Symbiodinium natans TaxID=878477 RepID=A0A812U6N0_9DINO|nr:unnamed protein product [Symbiodinium natans]